ncbi:tRNA (adenine(22)-N(1))-methyltransferase [Vagococcus sp.]|uniref:tRNA (adenine(22)-N(1))-methyltransferase n=1 Tax=Vagococcus sp. TaxID=1933889 RepID=UPI003F967933
MDYQHLSRRLALVAKEVHEGAIVADIGSDHAYLPAYLITHQSIKHAIAGEVVEGPFNSAKTLVEDLGLTDKIDVRLGDGLDVINPEDDVTTITICGMGGGLIRDILARGLANKKVTGQERLVLQPNVGEELLRRFLNEQGYRIIKELILEENKKFYEIIVAEKVSDKLQLSKDDLMFGPFLRQEKTESFIKKWRHELEQRYYVVKQLQQSSQDQTEKIKQYQAEINKIEEVLTE